MEENDTAWNKRLVDKGTLIKTAGIPPSSGAVYPKNLRDISMNRFAAGDCCDASGTAIPIGIVHCGLRGSAVTLPENSEV